MLDPVKTALAVVGGAISATAAWVTLKGQVARVRGDLNRMGSERVRKVEESQKEILGAFNEFRRQVEDRHEKALKREMALRVELARVQENLRMRPEPTLRDEE